MHKVVNNIAFNVTPDIAFPLDNGIKMNAPDGFGRNAIERMIANKKSQTNDLTEKSYDEKRREGKKRIFV